jgi:hypothetical protein
MIVKNGISVDDGGHYKLTFARYHYYYLADKHPKANQCACVQAHPRTDENKPAKYCAQQPQTIAPS